MTKHIDSRLLAGASALALGHAPERKDANLGEILAETKKVAEDLSRAWDEFKKTNDARLAEIEKKGAVDPVTADKLAKIERDLARGEELNQKLTLLEAATKAAKDKSDELELKIGRVGLGGGSPEQKAEERKKRVNTWARAVVHAYTRGTPNLSEEERKALAEIDAEMKSLSIGNDATGGYLAETEYVREIIKGITESSPLRSIARVRQTVNKTVEIPKRTGQFSAQWVSEQGARAETSGLAYGMVELPTHEMYALIDISHQNLEDSAFDLEAEIRSEAEEQFAVAEGAAFVSGSGVGKPEGFMANADVANTVSGSAATIADANGQANGLIDLKHALKTAYTRDANWVLNRTTLGSVRKLKDGDNNYIWMPGIAQGKPNTIDGDPYVELPDMPSEAAGAYPIAYGSFSRAYLIVDRIAMAMLRDPYTQATAGNIRLLFYKRVAGKVTLAEAIRKLKCAAA